MIPPSCVHLSRGFPGPASRRRLSGPLFVFQGRFDFRYVLIVSLENSSVGGLNGILLQRLQKVGQVVVFFWLFH